MLLVEKLIHLLGDVLVKAVFEHTMDEHPSGGSTPTKAIDIEADTVDLDGGTSLLDGDVDFSEHLTKLAIDTTVPHAKS